MALDGPWEVEVVADARGRLGRPRGAAADVETWELDTAPASDSVRCTPRSARARGRDRAEWSPSRGILKDPCTSTTSAAAAASRRSSCTSSAAPARLRAVIHAPRALTTNLAVGANAAKRAWLDGAEVELSGRGYLAAGPV